MKTKPNNIKKEDWDAVESEELSENLLEQMEPVSKAHPEIPKNVRGPQKLPIKEPVSIRLNKDIIDFFKSKGKGWQTKINAVLEDYINSL